MSGPSHFHIKWKEKDRFDWERFETAAEATERAQQIVQPNETFSIEPFSNDDCPFCRDVSRGRFV